MVVGGGREDLGLLRRDRRVALDEFRHHAPERLDAEGERGHVEEEDVLHLSLQHAALDRRADRDALVGVDVLVRLLAEVGLHEFDHHRHAGRAADEEHLVDILLLQFRVAHRAVERRLRLLEQVAGERLELRPREGHVEMLRAVLVGRDVGDVDVRLEDAGEFDLRLLRLVFEALHRLRVVREVDAVLFLEVLDEPVDDALVEVVAAEEGVAGGRFDLEDAVADLEHGDVEGAAAEVVDEHGLLLALLVDAVGEGGGGRLVDDAQHLEPGDAAGVLRGLALGVVEVGGHGDHGLGDLLAEVGFGVRLQFLKDHRRDLGRGVILAVDRDLVVLTHLAFDRADRAGRVDDRLALGYDADEAFAALLEGDDRGRGAAAFGVRDDFGLVARDDRHAGVRGAEVDA